MFILSLAIADLIVGAIVMPISSTYVYTKDWVFGRALCQFWFVLFFLSSLFSLLAFAFSLSTQKENANRTTPFHPTRILTDYTASTASILNILILTLDRYWSIRNPLQYLRKRTKKRALAMICIVWMISLCWAFPILFWHVWYNAGRCSAAEYLEKFSNRNL